MLITPGSSVGTVQLMLLNLLQAVVIMADISLPRVTKSREGNFARPPWFILCQAVHCRDDHRACQRWALESLLSVWGQYGHPLKCLGKDQRCLLDTFQDCPRVQKECSFPDDQKKTLKEKKGCCHSLLTSQSKLNPTAAPSAACAVNPPPPRAMQHERGVFWTRMVGSRNSNHGFLLSLRYMLTLEVLSPQSCSLTRHLLDCLQGLLEISCVLYFF